MNQNPVDNNIIYGSRLTWESGIPDSSTGAISANTAYLTTDYIPLSGKTLTYDGPLKDEGDVAYYVYIAQYKSDKSFITRIQMTFSGTQKREIDTWDECAYIKIAMGRSSSLGIAATTNDTDQFVATMQARKPNRFVDRSFSADSGDTVYSVTNNVLSITKWKAGTSGYNLEVPSARPLGITANASVRVVIAKEDGTLSGYMSVGGNVGGNNSVFSGKTWGTGATAFDESATLGSAPSDKPMIAFKTGANKTFTGYKVSIVVYLNGTQILPEVTS